MLSENLEEEEEQIKQIYVMEI